MSTSKILAVALASVLAAAPALAFNASDAKLSGSTSAYSFVKGDLPGGGVTNADHPGDLLGGPSSANLLSNSQIQRSADFGLSSAAASVSSKFGLLSVTDSASASYTGDPFTTGEALAQSQARFDDLITLFNPHLALGAPLDVRLTMSVSFLANAVAPTHSLSTLVAQGGIGLHGNFTSFESVGSPDSHDPHWHDPLQQTLQFTISNGETVSLFGQLTGQSAASVYNGFCDHCTLSAESALQVGKASFVLSGVQAGLTGASASGELYGLAAAVPEPSTTVMALAGGLLLVLRLRSRRA